VGATGWDDVDEVGCVEHFNDLTKFFKNDELAEIGSY